MEGEERDAERQRDAWRRQREPQQRVDVLHQEAGVFEDCQDEQIARHAVSEQASAAVAVRRVDRDRQTEIATDRGQQHHKVDRL